MRPTTRSTLFPLIFLYISHVSQATPPSRPPFFVAELMGKLDRGLKLASEFMAKTSMTKPGDYGEGGGCFSSYGTSLQLPDCQAALDRMPSENISPADVRETPAGPEVRRTFDRSNPLAWKHNNCVIGASVRRVRQTVGLYPPLRKAASLIVERCVSRAQGGLVRFGFFEVVLFDDTMLPQTPDPIFDFAADPGNIPWSTGLLRLWHEKQWAERAEARRAQRARNASTSNDAALSNLFRNLSQPR